jgi:dTMP kinase
MDFYDLFLYNRKNMAKRGLFITFEGGEGAGKTTLINSLVEELKARGKTVLKTREPGGTTLGEEIRNLLLHQKGPVSSYAELSLFLASRAQHIAEVIEPALYAGKVVLCDRFNDSSVAYQGAARGLGMDAVSTVCNFFSQNLKPDLTLYLDLDPEVGLGRASLAREQDRIEAETLAFHRKIREGYLAIHRKESTRFRLIDARLSPVEVFHKAMQQLESLLHV